MAQKQSAAEKCRRREERETEAKVKADAEAKAQADQLQLVQKLKDTAAKAIIPIFRFPYKGLINVTLTDNTNFTLPEDCPILPK